MHSTTLNLHPIPPFDFNLTAGYHTYFQGRSGADNLEDGLYRRPLDLDGRLALATVRSIGTVDIPELSLELQSDSLTDADAVLAAEQIRWMLGTDQDLTPFYGMAERDTALQELVKQFRGLHLPRTATLFESLILAILGQQISTSVARMMRTLIIGQYGRRADFEGATYHAFPTPEAILSSSVEELQALKLTQRKSEYVLGIAAATLEPDWTELTDLPNDEFVRRLTNLRGVGGWTAQWALVRGLGRPDALPLGDLALRRGVSRLLRDGEPVNDADVEAIAERWRPWRSYATAYIFAAMRSGMV